MKKITSLFILFISLITLFTVMAQLNYLAAKDKAFNSEGSDLAIEQAMYEHGFIVDAMDKNKITLIAKYKALFSY